MTGGGGRGGDCQGAGERLGGETSREELVLGRNDMEPLQIHIAAAHALGSSISIQ